MKNNIFDRARQHIEKEYELNEKQLSPGSVRIRKSRELEEIDLHERCAERSFFNKIIILPRLYWMVSSESTKAAIEFGIGIFTLVFILCYFTDRLTPVLFFRDLSSVAFLTLVIMCVCFIVSAIKNRKVFKSKAFYISLVLTIIISIPYMVILSGYGTEEIGDFFEKDNYTAKYYVEMSRKPEEETVRKVYTLPAEIMRIDGKYYINQLFFNNGGYLFFGTDSNLDNSPLTLYEEICIDDYHDDTYFITLTDFPAK